MSSKICSKDFVIVLSGKNKGLTGIVIYINKKKSTAIIKDLNIVKKHQKGNPSINKISGIIKKESPIHISNLSIFNKETNKIDRVRFKKINGKKIRIFKSTNKPICNKSE